MFTYSCTAALNHSLESHKSELEERTEFSKSVSKIYSDHLDSELNNKWYIYIYKYVCIIYIYIHIIYIYIYIYIYVYAYIYKFKYIFIYIYIHIVYIYICIHIYIHIHRPHSTCTLRSSVLSRKYDECCGIARNVIGASCNSVCAEQALEPFKTGIYMYIYTYIYTYFEVYMYIHIQIYIYSCSNNAPTD
jgi:hypothetical protein